MEFDVTLFQDEDGIWIAECPAVPGCVSQGETEKEALANVKEAIEACIAVRKELSMPPVVQHRTVRISA